MLAQLVQEQEKYRANSKEETMQGQHRVDSSFGSIIANETIPTNSGSSVYIGLSFYF